MRQIEEEASAALLEQLRKEDEAARVRQLALEEQANLSFALKLQQELDALSQSEEKLSANKFSSSVPFKSNVPSKPDVPFKPDTNDGNLPWKMSVCSNPPVAPVDYSAKSVSLFGTCSLCKGLEMNIEHRITFDALQKVNQFSPLSKESFKEDLCFL